MHQIGRNIVGKLRAARSYSSTTQVPAQVPAQVQNRVGPLLAGFSFHAGIACLYWTDFCGVRTKLKARAASHDEYERKHEEFKAWNTEMEAKKLARTKALAASNEEYESLLKVYKARQLARDAKADNVLRDA